MFIPTLWKLTYKEITHFKNALDKIFGISICFLIQLKGWRKRPGSTTFSVSEVSPLNGLQQSITIIQTGQGTSRQATAQRNDSHYTQWREFQEIRWFYANWSTQSWKLQRDAAKGVIKAGINTQQHTAASGCAHTSGSVWTSKAVVKQTHCLDLPLAALAVGEVLVCAVCPVLHRAPGVLQHPTGQGLQRPQCPPKHTQCSSLQKFFKEQNSLT